MGSRNRIYAAGSCCIRRPVLAYDSRCRPRHAADTGCGCSSVVEHDLAKVGVEGSSPFARSNFLQAPQPLLQSVDCTGYVQELCVVHPWPTA